MNQWEKLNEETAEGFDIVLSISPEDIHPADCFDTSTDPDTGKPYYDTDEMIRRIDNGSLCWFLARVEAYKRGILLASEYLGGTLYENPSEFLKDGYYSQMRDDAIHSARIAINALTADIHAPEGAKQ
jgi:hypothetical protein